MPVLQEERLIPLGQFFKRFKSSILVALFHFFDGQAQGAGGMLGIGDHRAKQVRDVVRRGTWLEAHPLQHEVVQIADEASAGV